MMSTRLGRTGLEVSRLCLGCMSYGVPERGAHPWTLGETESRPFIRRALDLGINFFDTANVYSDGTSEEIVGKALLDFAPREAFVLATKVHGRMHPGPNGAGLSRKAILGQIDASPTLKRQVQARLEAEAHAVVADLAAATEHPEPILRALGKRVRIEMAARVGPVETASFFAAEARAVRLVRRAAR